MKSVTLPRSEDKALVRNALPTSNIFTAAVVRLYASFDYDNSWKYSGIWGALAFCRDKSKNNSCFFRLIDLQSNKGVIWEQELYQGFQYVRDCSFLHSFETDDYLAGVEFVDEGEADVFYDKVMNRDNIKLKENRTKKNDVGQVRYIPGRGFVMDNHDPEVLEILKELENLEDFSPQDIEKNQDFIQDFINQYRNSNKKSRRAPPPPPPPSKNRATKQPSPPPPIPPMVSRNNSISSVASPPPIPPMVGRNNSISSMTSPPPPLPNRNSRQTPPPIPKLSPRPPVLNAGTIPPPPPMAPRKENNSSIPIPPPPPMAPRKPNNSSIPSPPPPPPPAGGPPPPPPPPPGVSASPPLPIAGSDGRTNLMAAIRSTGGFSNLKKGGSLRNATTNHPNSSVSSFKSTSTATSVTGKQDMASSLAAVLQQRKTAMQSDDEDDDDDDWE